MKFFPSASRKQTRYRVIAKLEQIRVIDVWATSEKEALEISLTRPLRKFRTVDERMELEGIRAQVDSASVRYFHPMTHTPFCHEGL